MSAGYPVLPPLKVRRTPSANYLYTYDHKWIPAIKGPDGEVIKKGYTDISNKKIVGKLVEVDKASFAVFYEEFFKNYPEMRSYTAFQNADRSWTFKLTSDLDGNVPEEQEAIDYLVKNKNYTVSESGRLICPADEIEEETSPADILSSKKFEDGRTILEHRPERSRKHSKELITTVHAGNIILFEELARSTGVTTALEKTVNAICNSSKEKFSAKQRNSIVSTLECLAMYTAITGNNTYEDIASFVTTHAVKDEVIESNTTAIAYAHLVDQQFIDKFNKNFVQIYKCLKQVKDFKLGLASTIDGTSIAQSNLDTKCICTEEDKDKHNQLNIQFVVDASEGGLPLFVDVSDDGLNEVAPHKKVLDKAVQYGLSFDGLMHLCDIGNCSIENFEQALRKDTKFLMNCHLSTGGLVTELIDEAIKDGIVQDLSWLNFKMIAITGGNVSNWSRKVPVRYDNSSVKGKSSSKKDCGYVTYHVYFDRMNHNEEERAQDEVMASAVTKLSRCEPLDTKEIALLKKCSNFDDVKYEPGTPLKPEIDINFGVYNELSKYFGFQVLVTNDNDLTIEEVKDYYLRSSSVQNTIQINKQDLNENTSQDTSDIGLFPKLMIQHLASILKSELAYRISCARARSRRRHFDLFSSMETVLDVLNSVYAEKYEAGYVLKPISRKQLHVLEILNVPMPKTLHCASQDSVFDDDLDSDDNSSDDQLFDFEED